MKFESRTDAGRQLARRCEAYRAEQPVVVALAAGGVVVGCELARALEAPLEVMVVRRLCAPDEPTLTLGAVANARHPEVVLNEGLVRTFSLSRSYIDLEVERQVKELRQLEELYRGGRPALHLRDKLVLLVDDGLATGLTMRAALRSVRLGRPSHVVVAVPVAPRDSLEALRPEVHDVICLEAPHPFHAIASQYASYEPVSDQQVLELLRGPAV